MVSQSRVSFSGSEQTIDTIDQYFRHTASSIRLYFSLANPEAEVLFAGLSQIELQDQFKAVSEENDRLNSMNLLSAIEAAFRIDYLLRCYNKKKDPLSRAFRKLHHQKADKASLQEDIFDAWKNYGGVSNHVVSDLKGAFNYRHWLAHGRYWVPKLGRKYDYFSIFTLGQQVVSSFPLECQ